MGHTRVQNADKKLNIVGRVRIHQFLVSENLITGNRFCDTMASIDKKYPEVLAFLSITKSQSYHIKTTEINVRNITPQNPTVFSLFYKIQLFLQLAASYDKKAINACIIKKLL